MPNGIFNLKQQLQGLIQKAWTGSIATNYVEYLVVAGGGGGGSTSPGGGGGAGGLLQGIVNVPNGSSITVTVGSGGTGSGSSGTNSIFGNISATGGGYSATSGNVASGGSGGGAAGSGSVNYFGGQGTFGQGNAGGANFPQGGVGPTGGGGGSGTVGLTGVSSVSGNGGAGIASSISGTVTTYAGGGGGGIISGTAGSGGAGGGGAGAVGSSNGTNGTVNTGGGGGGCQSGTPGQGGSGIVIISYPDTYNAPSALTGTYTASTSGSGSVYFNGSSYLTGNLTSSVGTGNFTIECWVYLNALVDYEDFFSTTRGTNGFNIGTDSTGVLTIYNNSVGRILTSSTGSLKVGQWYHVAYVRSGTTLTGYINGVSFGTATSSLNLSATAFAIGDLDVTNNEYLQGYITNTRLTNTAVYTSNFTPSTKPLTAISGTLLLLNTVSGSYLVDNSSNNIILSTTGTPSWNQISPFATGLGYKNRVYTWTGSGTVTF